MAAAALAWPLGPVPGAAQSAGDGWHAIERASPPAGSSTAPNTTVVPRALPDAGASTLVDVRLVGFLTDDGQRIDQGLVWRVFQGRTAERGLRLVSTHREASPSIRLPPGEYAINAALGRAHLTRHVSVKAGSPMIARFVLNAGGLRVGATLVTGEPVPDRAVSLDILSGERDQSGEREHILTGVRPGVVMRLNAGIYHLVSTYGDANAVVRADVTVEAGKVTEVNVVHHAARATLKLVMRQGGEALADTQWSIATPQGEIVKQSVGALPTHTLAPGTYAVTARHNGRSFRRDVTLSAGEIAEIEVVVQ